MNNLSKAAIVIGMFLCGPIYVSAAGPNWICFDAKYPQNYIDNNSLSVQGKNIVRYWEKAGNKYTNDKGKIIFPSYDLMEIDCKKKMRRTIKIEVAMEELSTNVDATKAKAEFYAGPYASMSMNYPSMWESIEPNEHDYARYNFVCGNATK